MIAISGNISLSQVRTELGLSGTFSMSNVSAYRLAGKSSAAYSLSETRGATWLGTNTSNLTLTQATGVFGYRYVVGPGVTVGGTVAANNAILVSSHPAGATVAVDNYGSILGRGGVGSGDGGGALSVQAGFTAAVRNYGLLYGGGGGGGLGGIGGTGGGGYYDQLQQDGNADTYSRTGTTYYWVADTAPNASSGVWAAGIVFSGAGYAATAAAAGGYTYYRGNFKGTENHGAKGEYANSYYGIYRQWWQRYYTNGGAGGSRGNGGRGLGSDGAAATGTAGGAGSAGGTNAGAGGAGGTGGAGAGTYGAAGNPGNSGVAGSAGNNGSGGAGSAGLAGGLGGYYLYRASPADCTFTNIGGSILGRLN